MIRAIIYARYSSENQRQESIDAQLRACRAFADASRYQLVDEYCDEAQSARTDQRTAFRRLLRDLETGAVTCDVILVHKFDRLFRDFRDAGRYEYLLASLNVRVESVLEPGANDETPEGALMRPIYYGMANFYSLNLAREIQKGMLENAHQARYNGGVPPLGLCVDAEGRYQIDERAAPAVRLIFARYAEGRSYREIAEELHDAGYRTRDGRPFQPTSFHAILGNVRYIGTYQFNRRAPKSRTGRRNTHKSRPAGEIVEAPAAFPALIDAATWERVQARRARNRTQQHAAGGQGKAKSMYLLSGILVCQHCGSPLVGLPVTTRAKDGALRRYTYYECRGRKRQPKCPLPRIPQAALETAVLTAVSAHLFTDDGIAVIAERVVASARAAASTHADTERQLDTAMQKNRRRTQHLVEVLANGGAAVAAIVEELRRLEREQADLDAQRAQLTRERERQPSLAAIRAVLRRQRDTLSGDTPHAQRALVQAFVEQITVGDELAEMHFGVNFGYGWCRWSETVCIQKRAP